MIEDSELALELEVERKRQEAIKKKYVNNLGKIKAEMKEQDDNTSRSIQIINQELEILKLEFQIEEAELDAPEKFVETIDINLKNGKLCCPTNQIQEKQIFADSRSLSEYFHVKNVEDINIKLDKIQMRYDQMHIYGYNYCNRLAGRGSGLVACILCPLHLLNLGVFHCYAGMTNCCYKMGSRTEKILKVYQRFQKYSNHSSLVIENKNKLEELQQILSQKNQICKQTLEYSSNTLELFNAKLESLKLQMENEDLRNEGLVQTIEQGRKIAACCTYSLQLEEVPCDAKALNEYFKIKNQDNFFSNLQKLEKMDKKLATCKWDCCIDIANCSFGYLKKRAQKTKFDNRQQQQQNRRKLQQGFCVCVCLEVCGSPFVSMSSDLLLLRRLL